MDALQNDDPVGALKFAHEDHVNSQASQRTDMTASLLALTQSMTKGQLIRLLMTLEGDDDCEQADLEELPVANPTLILSTWCPNPHDHLGLTLQVSTNLKPHPNRNPNSNPNPKKLHECTL